MKGRNFLTSSETISFSGWTLLQGVCSYVDLVTRSVACHPIHPPHSPTIPMSDAYVDFVHWLSHIWKQCAIEKVGLCDHYAVCFPLSVFELVSRFRRNFVWTLCHRRPPKPLNISVPTWRMHKFVTWKPT